MNVKIKQYLFEKNHGILNLILLFVCVSLILFYIVEINSFISEEYRIKILKKRLSKVAEEQKALHSQKFNLDSFPQIVQFTSRTNMVEARGVIYIFEETGLAKNFDR